MAKRSKALVTARPIQAATYRNPIEEWLRDAITEKKSDSGVAVTPASALGYSPVWHCVQKIAGHAGMLPCTVFEQDYSDPRKKRKADELAAYSLVKYQANPFLTAQDFRETIQMHSLLRGNGRAYIQRDARGEPLGLWPLPPGRTHTVAVSRVNDATTDDPAEIARTPIQWEKWHVLRLASGERVGIPDRDVLHIMGLSDDGLEGIDVLTLAREAIGLGLASERAPAKNFRSGARPSIMLKAPPGAFRTADEAQAFLDNFRQKHEGVENEGKVGLLTAGVEAQVMQSTARDSQWIEQRAFQRQEIALWFAVEQILGDNSSVSYNSLEQKNQAYLSGCLMRWLTKWEAEYRAKLLTQKQRDDETHYFKFQTAALLRGTTAERYQTYQVARQIKVMSANDVREREDMEPVEGGDVYENPAIATNDGRTEDTPDDPQASRRQYIAGRLESLFRAECKRLVEMAGKRTGAQFVEWLNSFYADDGFTSRVAAAFAEFGGTAADARDHAAESRSDVIKLAVRGGREGEPADIVADIVADWPTTRAKYWADRF